MSNHSHSAARMRPIALCILISLVLVGCSASSPDTSSAPSGSSAPSAGSTASASIEGCVPQCLPPGHTSPGAIPAGPYTTQYFFAGELTITFDSDGWAAAEDATSELHFEHVGSPNWHLFVWIDPTPVANLTVVEGIEQTPEAFVAWMESNPAIDATPGPAGTIAEEIPALTVDIEVPASATKDDPDCPVACTNFIGLEDGSGIYGNLVGEKTRIYLANVRYGGQTHLLLVSVEVSEAANFDAVLPDAQRIIDTFEMPVDPA